MIRPMTTTKSLPNPTPTPKSRTAPLIGISRTCGKDRVGNMSTDCRRVKFALHIFGQADLIAWFRFITTAAKPQQKEPHDY